MTTPDDAPKDQRPAVRKAAATPLSEFLRDENTEQGWGDPPATDEADEEWLRSQRPPHW